MSFLSPFLLWGVLAASIPIVIHLLNRRRHRTVQWAAMEFLLKATRESRGKKKLKYLIILTCRALAIVALVFAIARPLVGGFLGWSGGKVDTVILVLDRSASMEQQSPGSRESKRASAIASVRKSLSELNSPRLVLIDSASGKAQDVPSPDALEELSSTSATDTKASIPTLISTAIDYVLDHSPGRTEIWVASDLQESDWSPEEGRWAAIRAGLNDLPQKTTLRILSLASAPKDNISIRVLASRRTEDELVLDLELTRTDSDGPAAIPITYSVNGTRSADKVTVNGQTYQFQKRLPLGTREGRGHGFVSLPADTNLRDNVSYFAYGEDSPSKTYLVSEGGEAPEWLELAAAPPGFDRSEATRVSPNSAHDIDWSSATLIIWQAALPDGPVAEEFMRYIESGGAAILLPPLGESDTNFAGLSWGEQSTAPQGQYFIISEWDQADGPLRNGLEGTQIPVPKLKAIKRREILGEATSLALWDDEKPFLVRKVIGDGSAIFIATLPDYTWSNLADADALLPIVQRMIEQGDNRFGSAFAAITGSRKSMAADGETRRRLDTHAKSTSSNAPYEAGVWQLGDRLLATNRPKSEDQWQILTTAKLNSVLEGVPYKLFEDAGESESLAREIWRAFLIAMLVFLITEAILCLQPKLKNTKS
ncbi:BatA domain-containing protein [Verrucomicrobiaceae bacterium 5K15]|uniref:BatA domain-containing protein n=1 Tax=Oceaniferula flava TaxID=2800421 RepID=A0AAE2SF15_9BACT|nr:BatA domain-containing protein [Oceaniferula flavus]MBK1856177.1 BatA domain-containing protein [Oceaniferula flavus]MBM1137484.1 BatA domain-containing protein [Oceaniferula flavus]